MFALAWSSDMREPPIWYGSSFAFEGAPAPVASCDCEWTPPAEGGGCAAHPAKSAPSNAATHVNRSEGVRIPNRLRDGRTWPVRDGYSIMGSDKCSFPFPGPRLRYR